MTWQSCLHAVTQQIQTGPYSSQKSRKGHAVVKKTAVRSGLPIPLVDHNSSSVPVGPGCYLIGTGLPFCRKYIGYTGRLHKRFLEHSRDGAQTTVHAGSDITGSFTFPWNLKLRLIDCWLLNGPSTTRSYRANTRCGCMQFNVMPRTNRAAKKNCCLGRPTTTKEIQ